MSNTNNSKWRLKIPFLVKQLSSYFIPKKFITSVFHSSLDTPNNVDNVMTQQTITANKLYVLNRAHYDDPIGTLVRAIDRCDADSNLYGEEHWTMMHETKNELRVVPTAKLTTFKYKNEDILCPPAYEPTEAEVKLAFIRHIFDNYIWGYVHDMEEYYKYKEFGTVPSYWKDTPEKVVQRAERGLKDWHEYLAKWGDEEGCSDWWDCWDYELDWKDDGGKPMRYSEYLKSGLSDMHLGDCTAFPATCSRCYSENMFKVPYSAKWGGKSEGSRLYHEFAKDYDKHNPKDKK